MSGTFTSFILLYSPFILSILPFFLSAILVLTVLASFAPTPTFFATTCLLWLAGVPDYTFGEFWLWDAAYDSLPSFWGTIVKTSFACILVHRTICPFSGSR